jgi:AcrR family transcriptional regulator
MSSETRTPGRRADARRNADAIVRAAVELLSERPDASVAEVAQAAGVGRVTLYGHFPSRADLVEAAMAHVLDEGHAVLDPLDLGGDPREALTRLIDASWRLLARSRGILAAAEKELTPTRIRDRHVDHAARAERLIARGQSEGSFRTDLPTWWLVATLHNVIHGAADEIGAGRLRDADAARYITATLLGAFAPPS